MNAAEEIVKVLVMANSETALRCWFRPVEDDPFLCQCGKSKNLHWRTFVADAIVNLRSEAAAKDKLVEALAERCRLQSELLSRNAEKEDESRAAADAHYDRYCR